FAGVCAEAPRGTVIIAPASSRRTSRRFMDRLLWLAAAPAGDDRLSSSGGISLDHLVDAANQRHRDAEGQRLGGLHVEDELDFGRLLDRQVSRLLALKNSPGIDAEWAVRIQNGASISHEAASGYKLAKLVDRRHPVADGQCGELFAAAVEQCIGADHERA